MSKLLIEIEATKHGDTKFFDDMYEDDLDGQTGYFLQRFVRGSIGCDKLIVYLSADEPIQIWERDITESDRATKLLDIFREITNIVKKDKNEN